MILEIATFDIKENTIDAFKVACEKAKQVVSQSKGFRSLEFHQCLETNTKFVALISWETLKHHTVGFRESALFLEWRSILSPYFKNPPIAEHFEFVAKI